MRQSTNAIEKMMSRVFTPGAVRSLRPIIERLVNDRLDLLSAKGRADLMSELAFPIPAAVISHMLGIPEGDFSSFKEWSDEAFLPLGNVPGDRDALITRSAAAILNLEQYFRGLIAAKRSNPQDDLVSHLVQAQDGGNGLLERELVSLSAMLLAAGHETTTNQIGNAIVALLERPQCIEMILAQPARIEAAVEELLRYNCSAVPISRVALEDVQIGNQLVRAGQLVIGIQPAANRDPAAFVQPDRLDFDRPEPKRHLAFGHGPHFCLGAALARLELQIIVPAILRRLPNLRLASEVKWTEVLTFHGPRTLEVLFDAH